MNLHNSRISYSTLKVSKDWNFVSERESKIHRIHSYPAKFPSFIVPKALKYAKEKNVEVKKIADIFCGCGTTALEAKKNNLDFIGYDINPVATLIAKVKSSDYKKERLKNYYANILDNLKKYEKDDPVQLNNERILYWFQPLKIKKLNALISSILENVPEGKYQDFFLCGFSNILKATSRWLTKSIKPQIDPHKKISNVDKTFKAQIEFMINSIEKPSIYDETKINIYRKNVIEGKLPKDAVEILLTSPPYVTSYEYADLHQLSTMWLGYAIDYRKFRLGSVGSLYHKKISKSTIEKLNDTGKKIFERMTKVDRRKAQAIAKYFFDMNKAVQKSRELLKDNGLAFFVIGNTTYKGVKIDNANYLYACLIENKFTGIDVIKRKINSKILTPYRNDKGKFSKNPNNRRVYQYEYIIVAKK